MARSKKAALRPPLPVDAKGMAKIEDVINEVKGSSGRGFDNVELIRGSTYKDNSTVVIVPTRGMIHHRVVTALQGLMGFMNQKRHFIYCVGDEVGQAYTNTIKGILAHPELSKWKYILTLEDDNLPPPDAHIRLAETMEAHGFDAVSGIYFTKGSDFGMPMAYGDPEEFKRTGVLEFRPRDIRTALMHGHVMEVNGIAQGCALYKMDLFRQIPAPWFVTTSDVIEGKGPVAFTQDLAFCSVAKAAGKRFAVDLRVRVGHMDINTGDVY